MLANVNTSSLPEKKRIGESLECVVKELQRPIKILVQFFEIFNKSIFSCFNQGLFNYTTVLLNKSNLEIWLILISLIKQGKFHC
jgi:hypothetical protein